MSQQWRVDPTQARDEHDDLQPSRPGGQGSGPPSPKHTALGKSSNAAWTLRQLQLSFFRVRPRDPNLLIPAHKEVKRGCKHMETGTPSVRMLLLQGAEKTNQKRHGRKFYRTRSREEGQHQVDQFSNSVTSTQALSVFQLGSSVCELCPQASSPHGFNIAANVPGIAPRHHGRREKAPLLTRLFSQWETSPGSSSPSSFPLAPY